MNMDLTALFPFEEREPLGEINHTHSIHSKSSLVFTCEFVDFIITNCNAAFANLLGLSREDLHHEDIRGFLCEEEKAIFAENCEQARESYQGLLHFLAPGGRRRQLFTYLFHFPLGGQSYHGLIAYELHDGEKNPNRPDLGHSNISASFADTLTEVVEVSDANFTYTFVNERGCQFFGRSREDLIGTSTLDTIYEEDVPLAMEQMAGVMNGEVPTFEFDIRSVRSDGALLWTHFAGRSIKDGNGKVIGYLSLGWDIGERKKAEENLQRLKNQLEEMVAERTADLEAANRQLSAVNEDMSALFMNIPAGILVTDEQGNVTSRNNYLNEAHGKDLKRITELLSQTVRERANPYIEKLFHEGKPFKNIEITLSGLPGKDEVFFMTGVLLRQSGPKRKQAILMLTPGREMLRLANRLSSTDTAFLFENIITKDPAMLRTIGVAKSAAGNLGNVLITGESGTGKEMFAQSIHNLSARHKGPFIGINCGAIPRELIASELFGYSEGAFTGAKKGGKPGKFELAAGGTLFLDEIGDMPLEQQVALLRVIQEKKVTKLGGNKPIPLDCRIICATNVDLAAEIERNNFRRDLYYRLNVINVHIPPLRERTGDIPLLLEHFLRSLSDSHNRGAVHFPDEFLPYFLEYSWPGNVRELQNITERLFYLSIDTPLTLEHLPGEMLQERGETPSTASAEQAPHQNRSLGEILWQEKVKKQAEEGERILEVLHHYNGNISKAAKELGMARSTLYKKMEKYKL
ncbi:sigma 54-interacting transcriptional regulator [Ruminococcaceae bacterium OttesenSCG-928-I18]|nr:sigma 54-interacting transcriptional regulator [Ruminococcaceae bacterium OttesenSCG-928-I18]